MEKILEDQYVEVESLKLRYRHAGSGRSCIILIHGLGGYVENWERNLSALAQAHQVFALDLPGFGRSAKPVVQYSISYWVDFLHQFMQAQAIEQAILVGASLGGAIALQFALNYPQQVKKLVLTGSAGLGKDVSLSLRVLTLPILGEWLSRPSRNGSKQFWQQIFSKPSLVTDPLVELDYDISKLPGAQQSFLKAIRSLLDFRGARPEAIQSILGSLEKIPAPTLILWGLQDQILPVAHAQAAYKRFPDARLHVFDPCGHLPNIECAEEFNDLVLRFISL